jgi:polyhydroxybutyrate depolymerase
MLLLLALAAPAAAAPRTPLAPGLHERHLSVGGYDRRYLVHVPPRAAGGGPMPVVLALHGGGSNAEQMRRFSALDATGDREGFLAVFPDGTGRLGSMLTWNGGDCCGHGKRQGIDDVAFVRSLLLDLERATPVDPRRIYATGMSNGAIMSYRLACELSDRIAAIAPVAGPMGIGVCRPSRPVPVMHFHGTLDDFAPYEGGQGSRSVSGTIFRSVEESVRQWVALLACPSPPRRAVEPGGEATGMRAIRETWGPCRQGAEVVLITIEGGGHTWPGGDSRRRFLGPVATGVSANDLMWEFFERHPMPAER